MAKNAKAKNAESVAAAEAAKAANPKPVDDLSMKPVFVIAATVTVIVSAILTIFAWPLANATPHDLPIGLVSPSAQFTQSLEGELNKAEPGAFKFTEYKTKDLASNAILERQIYGAIVINDKPEVIVASGANATVAQLLNNISVQLSEQLTASQNIKALVIPVNDVAPLTSRDPRGLGLNAGSLPLVIAGIVVGILGSIRLRRTRQKFAVAAIAGTVASLAIVSILNLWLGSLAGNFWLEALVVAVSIAAVSTSVMGATALAGGAGMLGAIALFFIIGNPLSGVALAPEFYPGGLGDFGQLLPLGAEINLLRRISFFNFADTSAQWGTLIAWLIIGTGMLLLAKAFGLPRKR